MKDFILRRQVVLYLVFYFLIILYLLTFPTTVSWFLFYAFTLLLIISYASSSHRLVVRDVSWHVNEANGIIFKVKLSSKRALPLFLSSLKLTLYKEDRRTQHHQTAFFNKYVTVTFQPILLKRGRHESLSLDIEGMSLFGLWVKRATHSIPVDIDIYPLVMRKSSRANLMKEIHPLLSHAHHSVLHDFYVKELRAFQNRDSLSDIDWKTSMRRNQWMVKEYEREEEAPIDLIFYGQASEQFEALLSLTYSLFMEWHAVIKDNVFIIGRFKYGIETRQGKQAFLTVQPAQDSKELHRCLNESLKPGRKPIIVTSKTHSLPVLRSPNQTYLILDDDYLHHFKTE
ncbi:hypothetical protein GCM10008932_11510 [Alkalibacterium iburiense]|uniref:DUF58 domain-containing protein n=1 Tax=Alkalibacterium iburiense TaxID=290589 RepID=A0ABN0XC92_9LACT